MTPPQNMNAQAELQTTTPTHVTCPTHSWSRPKRLRRSAALQFPSPHNAQLLLLPRPPICTMTITEDNYSTPIHLTTQSQAAVPPTPIQGELPHQQTMSDEPIQSLCSIDELHQWNVIHINDIIYAILAEYWGRSVCSPGNGPGRTHSTSTPKSFLLIPTQHQVVAELLEYWLFGSCPCTPILLAMYKPQMGLLLGSTTDYKPSVSGLLSHTSH